MVWTGESDATWRTLSEAMPNLAWMSAPDGTLLWFNDRWCEYTGLDSKSSIALQYTIAAAAQGDHGAIFAFEETISAMMVRSRGLGLNINEGIGAGQIQVQQIDPAEISPGQFAYMVRESVGRY